MAVVGKVHRQDCAQMNLRPSAGEPITIQVKNKADYQPEGWRAMFAMAGNESFTVKDDANVGNRLTRRIASYHFGKKVDDNNSGLSAAVLADIGRVIWVCSWAHKVRQHHGSSQALHPCLVQVQVLLAELHFSFASHPRLQPHPLTHAGASGGAGWEARPAEHHRPGALPARVH